MQPVVRPGHTPPFYKLEEYTFQDLCRDLYANEPGIATCEIMEFAVNNSSGSISSRDIRLETL